VAATALVAVVAAAVASAVAVAIVAVASAAVADGVVSQDLMAETNVIHFGVDQQLASLRSKLLMSFGYQMHLVSSLSDLETTMRRRRIQGCMICQSVPEKLLADAQIMMANFSVPVLVLTNDPAGKVDSSYLHYSASSAREFLPKLQKMMPHR
jgi:hypothetical protein